jgi:hypothetical protein
MPGRLLWVIPVLPACGSVFARHPIIATTPGCPYCKQRRILKGFSGLIQLVLSLLLILKADWLSFTL